jgi:hypothetical protein
MYMHVIFSGSLRRSLVLTSFLVISTLPLMAQSEPAQISPRDGGAHELLESIFIPPKSNAPFSLTLETEWTRPMGNGGTYTLANKRRIMRDSSGRIYQERWLLAPKGGNIPSTMNYIQIADPFDHTAYNCEIETKICEAVRYGASVSTTYQPEVGVTGPLPNGQGSQKHEALGSKTIEGLDTAGSRDTISINAGVFGNDQPATTVRENWYSPQLGINLLSTLDSFRIGKEQFKATQVSTDEPDPKFFSLPEGFSVVDHRNSE